MAESLGLEVRPEFRPQALPLTSCLSLVPSSEWGQWPQLPGLRGPREHSAQPLPQSNTKHSNYDDLGCAPSLKLSSLLSPFPGLLTFDRNTERKAETILISLETSK